jgi:hypothetical protein
MRIAKNPKVRRKIKCAATSSLLQPSNNKAKILQPTRGHDIKEKQGYTTDKPGINY